MKKPSDTAPERRALSFLRYGPLVRRERGWRFGAAGVPDAIVDRLMAAGMAERDGDRLFLSSAGARR